MKENEKIKYFIYARKSSESEDRQMNSIGDQIKILTDLAKRENLDVVEILQESGSAKKPGRKIFNEMIERIHKGEAQGIIAWKLNRLARNPVDGGNISYGLQSSVIKKIVTTERTYRPDDNVLMMAVELGMANQFINDLSKDTRRGLLAKAERGWAPYMAPLGYKKHPDMRKGEKEIIKDQERFDLIRKIWDLVLSGEYNPVEALHYVTKTYGLRSRKGKIISDSNIYLILKTTFYYGEFEYPRGSGNWYQGAHEPMITKEEFDKVQDMIIPNKTANGETKNKELFPYKGPLTCGECGSAITAERKRRITCDCKHRFSALKSDTCPKCELELSEMKNAKVEDRIYYHCTKKKNKKCTQGTYSPDKIEDTIKNLLGEIYLPKEALEASLEVIRNMEEKESKIKTTVNQNINGKIGVVKKQLDNLLDLRLAGEIESDTFKLKEDSLKVELKSLEDILKKDKSNNITERAKTYFDFARYSINKFENSDISKRKTILQGLGSNQLLIDGKLCVARDNLFQEVLDLGKVPTTQKSKVRTSVCPYFTTKKTPFGVPNSEMLHR